MHIQDIFASAPTTFSFEFFPPKTDEASDQLFGTIAQLDAIGSAPGHTTVAMWLQSPPHRANLLDRRIRVAGFGIARGTGGRIVVTADFGG